MRLSDIRFVALFGAVAIAGACRLETAGAAPSPGSDGGGLRDAGSLPDAGPLVDGGPRMDAAGFDAGEPADAGGPGDAGGPVDAGIDADIADAGGCAPGTWDLDHNPANGCEYLCTYVGAESCNGADDDCDGAIDGPGAAGYLTFYLDADADGHGNASLSMGGCVAPAGYVLASDDCNDGNASVHPGALEVCDAVDQNCDGLIDDGAPDCGSCVVAHQAGRTYLFCNVDQSATGAETVCAGHGYHLTTIDDATEDAWVATVARTTRATGWWIGYRDLDRDGTYTWVAGSSMYSGWHPPEPSGGTEHCALIAWYGAIAMSWNDGDCTYRFPFVCEIS